MIQKVIILIALMVIINAQELAVDNSVNVREIVQKQIEEAKKKEAKAVKHIPASMKPVKMVEKPVINIQTTDYTLIGKIVVLGLSATIILSVVAIRRRKLRSHTSSSDLKTNIQLMRQEKFIKPIDPKLKKLRTNLCLNSKYLNNSESDITNAARKYNIAKTELLLAARLRNQTLKVS
ncbi:MAG: hypothetical protein QY331_02640 [Melioribacteraceae bacterium]|nr:MAG: hypothetical protein QY331_02640 [Melioribacteraceae bacterium]